MRYGTFKKCIEMSYNGQNRYKAPQFYPKEFYNRILDNVKWFYDSWGSKNAQTRPRYLLFLGIYKFGPLNSVNIVWWKTKSYY